MCGLTFPTKQQNSVSWHLETFNYLKKFFPEETCSPNLRTSQVKITVHNCSKSAELWNLILDGLKVLDKTVKTTNKHNITQPAMRYM